MSLTPLPLYKGASNLVQNGEKPTISEEYISFFFVTGYYKKGQQKELNEKQTVGKVHKFRPALHRKKKHSNKIIYMKSVTISEGFHIASVFQKKRRKTNVEQIGFAHKNNKDKKNVFELFCGFVAYVHITHLAKHL